MKKVLFILYLMLVFGCTQTEVEKFVTAGYDCGGYKKIITYARGSLPVGVEESCVPTNMQIIESQRNGVKIIEVNIRDDGKPFMLLKT